MPKEKDYTMFSEFVKEQQPDLYTSAGTVGIDLDILTPLYNLSENEALKSLRSLIRAKEKEREVGEKVDHIAEFVKGNGELLEEFATLAETLMDKILAYNEEHGALLKVDFDRLVDYEDSTDIIIYGRSPRGSKVRIPLDLKGFYAKAKNAGWNIDRLRLYPANGEQATYAKLQDDGTIKTGKDTYKTPNEWTKAVWDVAVAAGKRKNNMGNPVKSIMLPNPIGEYVALDKAYRDLMTDDTS